MRFEAGKAIGVYWAGDPAYFLVRGWVDEPAFAAECEAEGADRSDYGPTRHVFCRVGFAEEYLRADGCETQFYFYETSGRGRFAVTVADYLH